MTLPPGSLDHLRRLLAGQFGQGPGQDEGPALERTTGPATLGGVELEAQPALAETGDQLPDALVGELLGNLLGEDRADPARPRSIASGWAAASASIEPKCIASASALTEPTPARPSANRTRGKGCDFEASIASIRLPAETSPKPSSSRSCSASRP